MTDTAGVRRAAPALAAGTVLAVLLGGGWLLRSSTEDPTGPGDGRGQQPRVLRLADYRAGSPAGSSAGSADSGGATSRPRDGRFALDGPLPEGPDRSRVWWLTPPSRRRVTALARSLGFLGTPTTRGGATSYTSRAGTLRVQDGSGGQWQFGTAVVGGSSLCPVPPPLPSDKGVSVGCAVASPEPLEGTASSADQPGPVTGRARARDVARPVLAAAGLDQSRVTVGAPGRQTVVQADPSVGGLPTYGMGTAVTVSGRQVVLAGGWLGELRGGASYPVVGARVAYRTLVHSLLVQPLIACREPLPSGTGADPIRCGGPVVVTGAQLGLSLHFEGARPVLVPSWLFDVRGSTVPLSVVAVAPAFLDEQPGARRLGPPLSVPPGPAGPAGPAGPPVSAPTGGGTSTPTGDGTEPAPAGG